MPGEEIVVEGYHKLTARHDKVDPVGPGAAMTEASKNNEPMKADFFIDRPVFSTVLSVIIVIVGCSSDWRLLPVDQYPQIVPPVVQYLGVVSGCRCAQTVTQAVATPIEQELNGTPGMLYMESSSCNSGGFSATVTFDISTRIADLAAVEISRTGVKQAEARLPAEVVQNGISVEKQAASRLMTITLLSSDPKFDEIYLSNYATLNVLDMLRRVPGVGSVSNVGSRYYAMQIWVHARPAGRPRADGARTCRRRSRTRTASRRRACWGRQPMHGPRRDDPDHGAAGACRRWANSRTSSCGPTPTGRSSA